LGEKEKGLVMVYTGDGKGKTTAAVGMGLRAAGHGRRVHMIQFMKGPGNLYGEVLALRGLAPQFTVVQSGRDTFVKKGQPGAEDLEMARMGLERARAAMRDASCDMLILDEINVAVEYGLLDVGQVLGLLDLRPSGMDVVLTGRHAHELILERADMVSEVREVKHHYSSGVQAREGIEF